MSPDLTTNDPKKQLKEASGGLSADNSGAENHCTVFTINESPVDKNIIWVGTDDGNVQVTKDAGKTGTNVTAKITGVPKNTWVYYIEPSNFVANTAYVVFDGHTMSDFKPYVMKTTDGGNTWKSVINEQIPVFARCIKEDHLNPDILYLGTEMGLYISLDGGSNWARFDNIMPQVAVHYLAIQKEADALVMATHGRGVIIIDDLKPLRAINENLLSKDLAFVNLDPAVITESVTFQEFPAVGEYLGDTPTISARIVYYMNKRHTFGKMTMEIFVRKWLESSRLSSRQKQGYNEVLRNYILPLPKTAKGKTFTFGGFAAPKVPAGKYTVKINKGKEEYTQDLVLKYDPSSIHSEEDRKVKDEKAMELYRMMEFLADEVDKIDQLQSTSESIKGGLKDKKMLKKIHLNEYFKEIEDLRKILVVTTGDNYVGAAEPQLREKIANLYGQVLSYAGKPTNAQLKNLDMLQGKLNEAKTKIKNLEAKAETINKLLEKNKIVGKISTGKTVGV